MSWLAHPLTVRLRNLGRAVGVNRWLAAIFAGPGYESSFERAVVASVKPGDQAWDVGANVGLYTRKLLEAAGGEGASTPSSRVPSIAVVSRPPSPDAQTSSWFPWRSEIGTAR